MVSISVFIISLLLPTSSADSLEDSKIRCAAPAANEAIVYQNEFQNPKKHLESSWWWTNAELNEKFTDIYSSGKRLALRASYDAKTQRFVLPYKLNKSFVDIVVPENFILSVRKHIEAALKNKYAEQIFFPDMGHSHFYFETAHYEQNYFGANQPADLAEQYTRMLADKKLRVLYHTSEKLLTKDQSGKLLKDPHVQYRYWNRNIVGGNVQSDELQVYVAPKEQSYNTVNSIEGHSSWSAGFNVSASINGCFPYTHNEQTYYFDLSLYDLEYDKNGPGGSGDYF